MSFEKFTGVRGVRNCNTSHEATDHRVEIKGSADKVEVSCLDGCEYPPMQYHPPGEKPARLTGTYRDGHTVTITRREDGRGIDTKVAADAGGSDTGSWTADDPGTVGGDG